MANKELKKVKFTRMNICMLFHIRFLMETFATMCT